MNDHSTCSRRPEVGVLEWFRPGEHDRVEQVLSDLNELGVTELRTGVSWADWHTQEGKEWYRWLLPKLSEEINLLPCFTYTPPSLGIVEKTASPPRDSSRYSVFVDRMLTRYGDCCAYVELWNEPNNINDWDWRIDPSWEIFSNMIIEAAKTVRSHDKKPVLAGMCPTDPNWLDLMAGRGVLDVVDVVGIHGFPGTWEFDWKEWSEPVSKVREVLEEHDSNAELWITEAGYSTWQHDEFQQLQEMVKLCRADVQRAYWYSAYDLHPELPHQDGYHEDERHYHFGLKRADGRPKLLYRIWAEEGLEGVKSLTEMDRIYQIGPEGTSDRDFSRRKDSRILITGGAGFIGTNLAKRLLSEGKHVLIYDNLSRPGVEDNLRYLHDTFADGLEIAVADVRDQYTLEEAVACSAQVYHLAGQTAVTTSLKDPREDFEINTEGTIHLLEAMRVMDDSPSLVFTSTNKVYGALADVELCEDSIRFTPVPEDSLQNGVTEQQQVQFTSPYGCSKGAADQYVLNYAQTYELPAAVFRMSCIYGPHQRGTEDQGWVAHFTNQILSDEPITIFGNGLQVRDVLFVEDLVDALIRAQQEMPRTAGEVFNIGGGPDKTVSLLELIQLLEDIHGKEAEITFDAWRSGDQRYYVSNIDKFREATGWEPSVGVDEGLHRLYNWLQHLADVSGEVAVQEV